MNIAAADAARFHANQNLIGSRPRHRNFYHIKPSVFGKQQGFHHALDGIELTGRLFTIRFRIYGAR